MNNQPESPDPAAIFACALSLWRECVKRSHSGQKVNLSECYNGGDEFMRVIMRVGARFEEWACAHIEFEALNHCWPYLLEERFGEACIAVKGIAALKEFDDEDCLAVSLRSRLPVKAVGKLPIPVDISAWNPVSASEFRQFRIQTMREFADGSAEPFTSVDDPFDDNFGPPFFRFYGVCDDGMPEHIADFVTYAKALRIARKLAPGIQLPDVPHSI
jgi:hypothetical protein